MDLGSRRRCQSVSKNYEQHEEARVLLEETVIRVGSHRCYRFLETFLFFLPGRFC